jgi:hydroxymethylpyrimidine pyrophosphatase-like HAD family hydrolase
MSRFVLASDLDRTLVHSAARLLPGEDAPVVEIYKERGITVARDATIAALSELATHGAFVPVTTRSREQVARITPVWEMASDGWLICANGATLLHRGQVDRTWKVEIDRVAGEAASVAEARQLFELELGSPDTVDWMPLLRDCDKRFLYCTLDLEAAPADLEDAANHLLGPFGWHAILHGRKLYALPEGICKGRAVRHLRERLEIEALMAAGDSALDIELLLAAEERWCPIDAELVEQDRVPEGTQLTEHGHVAAGEEIATAALRWATAQTA